MKKIIIIATIISFSAKLYSQVNLQTGTATFNLPMFNWQDNKSRLNAMVGINYTAGNGLKVNDIASNAGQGWNLSAGGVINRMQAGEPDDQIAYNGKGDHTDQDISKYPAGIMYATVPAYKGCPTALTRYPIYGWKNQVYIQRNIIAEDKQLDYFSFQFNGKTGMFVIDPKNPGIAKSLGDTKMKIAFQEDPGMTSQGIRTTITSFTVQDMDGLIYRFTSKGLTKILQFNYCDQGLRQSFTQPNFKSNRVYYQSAFDNGDFVNPWIINSWYLSEVEDPLTHRKITYNYTTLNLINSGGEDITYNSDKDYSIVSHKISVTRTPEIASIVYPDGHSVVFNYGAPRIDLAGEYALASVDITYQGRYLSKYLLNTSYVILNRWGNPVSSYQKQVCRLYLKSIKKISADLKEDNLPYIFDYYLGSNTPDDFVPPPFFYAKDIWGYYNGSNSIGATNETIPLNASVFTLGNRQTQGLCFQHTGVSGVYINTKTGYAKNGLLRQIIYPTGGTLTYQYDQNLGNISGFNTNVGGVHVSQTSATDGGFSNGCSNPVNTQYNYVINGAGSASSLWGVDLPVNSITSGNHYQPEWKSYHWTLSSAPFGECYWHYKYPGIISQQQAVSLTGLVKILNDLAPYLGAASIVSTIMDIVTVCTGGSPVSLIIDIIGGLVNIGLTCIGNQVKDNVNTIYYNADLNGVAALPTQFKRVEIVENTGSNGKTVQEFTSSDDYPIWEPTNPTLSAKQRFAPWAYGLPKLTSVYNANGELVKQTENTYDYSLAKSIINVCVIRPNAAAASFLPSAASPDISPQALLLNYCDSNNNSGVNSSLISCKCFVVNNASQRNTDWSNPAQYSNDYQITSGNDIKVNFYGMYSGRTQLIKTRERSFKQSDPTKYLETITDYTYNALNYNVSTITTTQSNAQKNTKSITYSADYGGSQNAALVTLVQNNILDVPVSVLEKVNNGTDKILSEKVTEFMQITTGDIKPVRILEQRFAQPNVSAIQYWPDNVNNATIYKTIQSFTYDASGNLTGQKDEGNRILTNIYDYQDKYIVATVINADALLDKCAYSSFETTGFGGWTQTGSGPVYASNGVTGSRAFVLNGNTFTRSGLNTAKSYLMSFWANASGLSISGGATLLKSAPAINGFTYYEYAITQGTPSISIAGNATIDELRLYPAMARMRTTTYDPLIGKTSDCDENNRVVYYEYNNLGQLQFIKDDNRNVVKMYEYNTISPTKQNGCPAIYYNHLISEIFTKECAAGYTGSDVVFTIPANIYSSAIGQDDADAQAENYLLANGQVFANANGTCKLIYYNTVQSKQFLSENCPAGYTGGFITYTVPANKYSTTESQAAADQMAKDDLDANGDAFANTPANANCILNTTADWDWPEGGASYCSAVGGIQHLFLQVKDVNPNSPTFGQTIWKDAGPQDACPPIPCQPSFTFTSGLSQVYNNTSLSGSTVSFSWVVNYPGNTSYFSLGNITSSCCFPSANRVIPFLSGTSVFNITVSTTGTVQVALVSGPVPTGTVGFNGSYDLYSTTFYSAAKSGTFTRNNCITGQTGSSVTYNVLPYRYTSLSNQSAADQKAQDEVNTNGQAYANTNGICSTICTFTPASGVSFYSASVSTSQSTVSFNLVFPAPNSNYSGGSIGTIGAGCRPGVQRVVTVTDGSAQARTWSVTISNTGNISISLVSGPPVTTQTPPIVLVGSFSL
jgi:hypothetical protein